MNLTISRRKMLDQQIRPWDVREERLLSIIAGSPREDYMLPEHRNLAYVDMSLPIGFDQVTMAPKLEARLIQSLDLTSKDKVLEIGTGSGYVTALLAQLANHVHSVEIIPALAQQAKKKLAEHNIRNVTIEIGDAARGWAKHAPYDAIFVGGSLPLPPDAIKEQLAPGARMVVIVGRTPAMDARRIARVAHGWDEESMFETVVPALVNAPEPAKFIF
ncbi:MAG: protein-L-isoaspartate O-methyltransferase [Gammaproteobacteria bacterium]|nr:protein-L-isoaspartate O-methyltransferase [Gammaproteobacteria bacterium]